MPKPDKLEPPEEPEPSKGAVPKRKTDVRVTLTTDSVLDEFEEAIKEFRQGEISTSPKRRRRGQEAEEGNVLFSQYFVKLLRY